MSHRARRSLGFLRRYGAAVPMMVILALLLVTGTAAASPRDTQQSNTIRIQYYPGVMASLPSIAAQELGIYRRNNLNVELVPIPTAPEALAAIASGSVDLMGFTGGGAMVANSRGLNMRAVAGMVGTQIYSVLGQKSLPAGQAFPANVRAMRGKKIGLASRGADNELVMRTLLQLAGLNADRDVSFVALGPTTSQYAAWGAGLVDYLITVEPTTSLLTKRLGKANIVMDLRKPSRDHPFSPWLGQALFARADTIENRKPEFNRLRNAIAQTVKYMSQPANQKRLAPIVKTKLMNFPLRFLRNTLQDNRTIWSSKISCAQIQAVGDWVSQTGIIPSDKVQSCAQFVWQPAR